MKPILLTPDEYRLHGIGENEIGFQIKEQEIIGNESLKKANKYPSTPLFSIRNSSILSNHSSLNSTALSDELFNSTIDQSTGSPLLLKDSVLRQRGNIAPTKSLDHFFLNSSTKSLENFSNRKNLLFSGDSDKYLGNYHESFGELSENTPNHIRELSNLSFNVSHNSIRSPDNSFNLSFSNNNSGSLARSPENTSRLENNSFSLLPSIRSPLHSVSLNRSVENSFKASPLAVQSFDNSFNLKQSVDNSPHQSFSGLQHDSHESSFIDPRKIPIDADYQSSIKMHAVSNNPDKSDEINYSCSKSLDAILARLDVDKVRLIQMVENIRKWISQTIISNLVSEIDSINKSMTSKALADCHIGGNIFKVVF